MAETTMQYVPLRLQGETVEEIDEITAILGGNRSEFIRLAVDERLARLRPLLARLAEAGGSEEITLANAEQFAATLGGLA